MRRWLAAAAFVLVLAPAAPGANALRVRDGKLEYWSTGFAIWGIELEDWPRLVADPEAMRTTFQAGSDRGINTVGYALQRAGEKRPFFAPDGQPADKELARQFTRMTRLTRDHHLASVVSLFSADREHWLASAEAYRTAARSAARLLDGKHSVILVAGDLFGAKAVSPECPYPLNDAAKAIEICRWVKEANPEAMVGIPAALIATGDSAANPRPVLYVAASAEVLTKLITPGGQARSAEDAHPGIITVDGDHFLRVQDAADPPAEARTRYLREVERRRLALRPPMPPPKGPMPADLLTAEEKAAGWVPLFDGRTLQGWTTLAPNWGGWLVEQGTLKCTGKGGRWLRTLKRYRSFVLRFECRIVKNGNSGVFVWSPLAGRSSRFGMEMQIRGVHRDKVNTDTTGAIYAVRPPREDASNPPGEWNQVEIACRGSKVTITVNGRVVQDFDADAVPELKGRLRRGVIGLQDHGCEVWFRRIRIRELGKEP